MAIYNRSEKIKLSNQLKEIKMYGQPCFERDSHNGIEYFLDFARVFSDVFNISSNKADDYVVIVIQDEKKIITHPVFLIKKNYRIINHSISIFGQSFNLHQTLICIGYAATFID
jgi:hypothetical protein